MIFSLHSIAHSQHTSLALRNCLSRTLTSRSAFAAAVSSAMSTPPGPAAMRRAAISACSLASGDVLCAAAGVAVLASGCACWSPSAGTEST